MHIFTRTSDSWDAPPLIPRSWFLKGVGDFSSADTAEKCMHREQLHKTTKKGPPKKECRQQFWTGTLKSPNRSHNWATKNLKRKERMRNRVTKLSMYKRRNPDDWSPKLLNARILSSGGGRGSYPAGPVLLEEGMEGCALRAPLSLKRERKHKAEVMWNKSRMGENSLPLIYQCWRNGTLQEIVTGCNCVSNSAETPFTSFTRAGGTESYRRL